jgi:hypothetical protein
MTITTQQQFAKELDQLVQKYLPVMPICANDFTLIIDVLAEVKERLELASMRYPIMEDEVDDMSDRYRP